VLIVWFGEFPEGQAIPGQLFDVFTAFVGLAAFAIVLALVEQVLSRSWSRVSGNLNPLSSWSDLVQKHWL
jgi:hypothetical protein